MLGGDHRTTVEEYTDSFARHRLKPLTLMVFATRCALRMWSLLHPSKQLISRGEPQTRRFYESVGETIDLAVRVCRAVDDAEGSSLKRQAQGLSQRLATANLDNPEGSRLTKAEVECGIAAEALAHSVTNYYSPRGASLADTAGMVAAAGQAAAYALQPNLGVYSEGFDSALAFGAKLLNKNWAEVKEVARLPIEGPVDPGEEGPLGPLWDEGHPEPLATRWGAAQFLGPLDRHLDVLHKAVIDELQLILIHHLAGRSFGSLEGNQAVAAELQRLLDRLGLRVKCLREGCGQPARLRCTPAAGTRAGSFQFEHQVGGRQTRHGGYAVLPRLELVPAPPESGRRRSATDATSPRGDGRQ